MVGERFRNARMQPPLCLTAVCDNTQDVLAPADLSQQRTSQASNTRGVQAHTGTTTATADPHPQADFQVPENNQPPLDPMAG